jgi:hypothetical protein
MRRRWIPRRLNGSYEVRIQAVVRTHPLSVVNDIMRSPEWRETAIVIAYDDSD